MKARIPLPNDLKSAVKTEIAAEWKKIQKEKSFLHDTPELLEVKE